MTIAAMRLDSLGKIEQQQEPNQRQEQDDVEQCHRDAPMKADADDHQNRPAITHAA